MCRRHGVAECLLCSMTGGGSGENTMTNTMSNANTTTYTVNNSIRSDTNTNNVRNDSSPYGVSMNSNTMSNTMGGSGNTMGGSFNNDATNNRYSSRNDSDGIYSGGSSGGGSGGGSSSSSSSSSGSGNYKNTIYNRYEGIATNTMTTALPSSYYSSDASSASKNQNPNPNPNLSSGNGYNSKYSVGTGDITTYSSPGQHGYSTSKKKNDSYTSAGQVQGYPDLSSNHISGGGGSRAYNIQGDNGLYSSSDYDGLPAVVMDRSGQGSLSNNGHRNRASVNGPGSSSLQDSNNRKKPTAYTPTADYSALEMRNSADSLQLGGWVGMHPNIT